MPMSALQRRLSNKTRLGGKPKVDRDSIREKVLKRKGKIEAKRDITAKLNIIAGRNVIVGHGSANRKLDANTKLDVNGGVQVSATLTVPANPPKSTAVIYVVGGATAAEGDVVIKTTNSAGTTKTTILADFSAL